jgi:hypothetical protein
MDDQVRLGDGKEGGDEEEVGLCERSGQRKVTAYECEAVLPSCGVTFEPRTTSLLESYCYWWIQQHLRLERRL